MRVFRKACTQEIFDRVVYNGNALRIDQFKEKSCHVWMGLSFGYTTASSALSVFLNMKNDGKSINPEKCFWREVTDVRKCRDKNLVCARANDRYGKIIYYENNYENA